jgi:hypothetical protein
MDLLSCVHRNHASKKGDQDNLQPREDLPDLVVQLTSKAVALLLLNREQLLIVRLHPLELPQSVQPEPDAKRGGDGNWLFPHPPRRTIGHSPYP